jgi:hypothetical protein
MDNLDEKWAYTILDTVLLKSSKVKIKLKDATNVRIHISFAQKLNALSIKQADKRLVHLPCCHHQL